MSDLILVSPNETRNAERARHFCEAFCNNDQRPKYVFGRNVYAGSVAKCLDVTGFIDDFTDATVYLGRPVLKTEQIPSDALVLVASGGRPFAAKRRLDERGIQSLDYFSFYRWSGLPLIPVVFNEGFEEDFRAHRAKYEWVYGLLEDDTSREVFRKLVSFRLKYDLDLLTGFTQRETEQYFEDFLELRTEGETFVDVGGFNGYNSLEFIRLCPGYRAVHVFEPEPGNYEACVKSLSQYPKVHIHQMGLSNEKGTLRLDAQGSGSKISDQGAISIQVDRLDDVLTEHDAPTFIKMDIEGAELAAIEGARATIAAHHPRLALCVYHNVGDFYRIPESILAIRKDYTVFVRHYTESIYETVMFFIPKR